MMSACTKRDYRPRVGMYSRVTWTTLALLFLCVALSEHGCEVSADSEVCWCSFTCYYYYYYYHYGYLHLRLLART